MKINEYYKDLRENCLFTEIARRVDAWQRENPGKKPIRLGIGDVTLPLVPAVVAAMQAAVAEMGCKATFHGYGPEQGYGFLREAVAGHYQARGVDVPADDVFVSDGAKSDLGNILDLFAAENTVLIPDPVNLAYVDTNVMAGRRTISLDANEDNGFLPLPDPSVHADIIYLCSPNNPTGAVYSRGQLQVWVDYAREQDAVILFDATYEAFVRDGDLPRSIYELEGAKDCAIEFCSLSKTAGFTGTRCGWTVVPAGLSRGGASLRSFWLRRQTAKFNGVPYIVQRGAAAVFTEAGQRQTKANLAVYQENARLIADTLRELGIWFVGGENSPYIWLKCPSRLDSWAFFDKLMNETGIVGTPGSGFGRGGEGFFRLTAFGDRSATEVAMKRLGAV